MWTTASSTAFAEARRNVYRSRCRPRQTPQPSDHGVEVALGEVIEDQNLVPAAINWSVTTLPKRPQTSILRAQMCRPQCHAVATARSSCGIALSFEYSVSACATTWSML